MAEQVHYAHSRMGVVCVYTPSDRIEWCEGGGAPLTAPALFTRSSDKKGLKSGIRYVRCTQCSPVEIIACSDCGQTSTAGWGIDGNLINADGSAQCRSCADAQWQLDRAIAKVESAGYRVMPAPDH